MLYLHLDAVDEVAAFEAVPVEGVERVRSRGYSFMQEVLYRCQKTGCRIGEVPIVFVERQVGASKVNLRESARSLGRLLALGVPTFFGLDAD